MNGVNCILLAATKLAEAGNDPFSTEDLIVASWQESPTRFGLAGFNHQYPDSNRVLTNLMGCKSLIQQGLLSKVDNGNYTITEAGKKKVIESEVIPGFRRMLKVAEVLANGAPETFTAACDFWGLIENDLFVDIDKAIDACTTILEFSICSANVKLDSQSIDAGTVSNLAKLHHRFIERYHKHCNVLRTRHRSKDESKNLYHRRQNQSRSL